MKRALTILVLMALGASTAFGGVFMVEDYTEGSIYIFNPGKHKLATAILNLDNASIVHVVTGGRVDRVSGHFNPMWLVLNGDSLGMSTTCGWHENPNFMIGLEPGSHTLDFVVKCFAGDTIVNPRLQVLVLYNDAPSVSETPPQPTPTENPSIISCGPSVTVPGCCEVVDVSGRKVDCEINGDRIMVNSLSSGTYFATGSNGRTTKIVKLK